MENWTQRIKGVIKMNTELKTLLTGFIDSLDSLKNPSEIEDLRKDVAGNLLNLLKATQKDLDIDRWGLDPNLCVSCEGREY